MTNGSDNRDHKGRFADQRHEEAVLPGALVGAHGSPGAPAVRTPLTDDPDFYAGLESDLGQVAASATSEDLEAFVAHPNPFVRAEVASHPALSAEQAWRLAADEQPIVRWQMSRVGASGLAEHMSNDPDPAIRAECLGAHDLTDETRQRLLDDPGVREVREALTTSGLT
jgi:hypothetical protein